MEIVMDRFEGMMAVFFSVLTLGMPTCATMCYVYNFVKNGK
jgi:hypothetical protein